MAVLTGFRQMTKLLGNLKTQAEQEGLRPSWLVGYSAPYALYVHEDLTMNHPNGGQAKFLEQPARVHAAKYRMIIRQALKRGTSLKEALLQAARALRDDSVVLVPIDTGFLVMSVFIRGG